MTPINNGQEFKVTCGLDIGSSSITCAIGHVNRVNKQVKLQGISSKSSVGIKKGVITNRDELIDTLENVLSETELMANIKITNIVLSITGDHIRSLNTQAAIPLNRSNVQSATNHDRAIDSGDIFQVLDLAQAVSLPVDRDILHTLPQEYLVDTLDEIKNPLGGLRGAAQLLSKELNEEQQEYTAMIIEQADRLTNLVDRLLGPNQLPQIQKHNIHSVLEKVYQVVSYSNEQNVQLRRDYDPSIPSIECDQEKVQQAVFSGAKVNGLLVTVDTVASWVKLQAVYFNGVINTISIAAT